MIVFSKAQAPPCLFSPFFALKQLYSSNRFFIFIGRKFSVYSVPRIQFILTTEPVSVMSLKGDCFRQTPCKVCGEFWTCQGTPYPPGSGPAPQPPFPSPSEHALVPANRLLFSPFSAPSPWEVGFHLDHTGAREGSCHFFIWVQAKNISSCCQTTEMMTLGT